MNPLVSITSFVDRLEPALSAAGTDEPARDFRERAASLAWELNEMRSPGAGRAYLVYKSRSPTASAAASNTIMITTKISRRVQGVWGAFIAQISAEALGQELAGL